MTYRSLKTFIKNNTQENNTKIFDLVPNDIKSKIIFVVGEEANNTSEFLCSIMSTCEIKHTRYKNTSRIDLNKRFLQNGEPISQDVLCENAEKILKITKRIISSEDLLLCLTLSLTKDEYVIIEISEDYYNNIKDCISPFALILALRNDEKAQKIIENAPGGVKEIISLSQKDDFDYISAKTNKNGARITFASPNKITISGGDIFGTSFYHYSYLYHIAALDLNNLSLAHLGIEAAKILFDAPRPYIYKGLETATIPHDLTLYSLSPTILLREGENDFKLHHKLKFRVINENNDFSIPKENTIFCGNQEYINTTKEKLKKR